MCPHMGGHTLAQLRNLATTIEPSVCGGDAALYQITLTTCAVLRFLFVFFYKQQNSVLACFECPPAPTLVAVAT